MRLFTREAKRKITLFIIFTFAAILCCGCSEYIPVRESDITANNSPSPVVITDDPVATGELPITVPTDNAEFTSPIDPIPSLGTSSSSENTSLGDPSSSVDTAHPNDTPSPFDTISPSDTSSTADVTPPSDGSASGENEPGEIPSEPPQSLITAPPDIDIPVYTSSGAYIVINDNIPFFTEPDKNKADLTENNTDLTEAESDQNESELIASDLIGSGLTEPYLTTIAFEHYSDLDSLGRCGFTFANICKEIMPTEPRGSIGQVKPTGWQTVKYDIVEGKYLYNRCHLIGFQLSAENANTRNLITGTRYLNIQGMLPFENMVADYVKETNNHVLYRVTPLFNGNDLVASGVLIEALSVEDEGEGICFNVFCYNVQPGIAINYSTGTSAPKAQAFTYILNTNTHKFHFSTCYIVRQMREDNGQEFTGDRDDIIADGYTPCGICTP